MAPGWADPGIQNKRRTTPVRTAAVLADGSSVFQTPASRKAGRAGGKIRSMTQGAAAYRYRQVLQASSSEKRFRAVFEADGCLFVVPQWRIYF